MSSSPSPGGSLPSNDGEGVSTALSQRLARETSRHMEILERLGGRLLRSMDSEVCRDKDGVATSEAPNRDWCRGAGIYQAGMASLLSEERERTKLRLLAERDGSQRALTAEEYDAELRTLAIEALRALPPGELTAEVERRGLLVTAPVESDE